MRNGRISPVWPAALVAAAAAWRLATLFSVPWANLSPIMAMAFCGGVYFRRGWMWLAPFAALLLSDAAIDLYYRAEYHYGYSLPAAGARLACFAAGLGLGAVVARRRSPPALLGGCLASSLLFYFVTNTLSWAEDAGYAHDAAGWWQALTVGHPQFPPTWYFFRNTLIGDLGFTAIFALAMAGLEARARASERGRLGGAA